MATWKNHRIMLGTCWTLTKPRSCAASPGSASAAAPGPSSRPRSASAGRGLPPSAPVLAELLGPVGWWPSARQRTRWRRCCGWTSRLWRFAEMGRKFGNNYLFLGFVILFFIKTLVARCLEYKKIVANIELLPQTVLLRASYHLRQHGKRSISLIP